MSNLVHLANSIEFHPNRDSFDAKESLEHLWTILTDFGGQHCIYACAGCLKRLSVKERSALVESARGNYRACFDKVHNALGQLPQRAYNHLRGLAKGECPACAVLTALKQFPAIAQHSETSPIGFDALPCFLEEAEDDTGFRYWAKVRHVDALHVLNLGALPPRLTPADRHEIKARLAPGKAVVDFIRGFLDGRIQLRSSMTDDDLWDILHWRPIVSDSFGYEAIPSRTWINWAKKEIMSGRDSADPLFLCRVLRVALSCYSALRRTYIENFDKSAGLEYDALRQLFFDAESICGISGHWSRSYDGKGKETSSYYQNFSLACQAAMNKWVTVSTYNTNGKNGYRDYQYISLSFGGKRETRAHGGAIPEFEDTLPFGFSDEIGADAFAGIDMPDTFAAVNNTNIDSKAVSNSNAQAAALGGDGGKGGDSDSVASVAIKKDVVIEKDGIKQIQTTNVAAPDLSPFALAEQARQDGETKRLQLVLEQLAGNAAKVPAEAPLDGPLRDTNKNKDTSGYASSADLAKKHGIKHVVLKKRLERFRKETLTGWIEVADRGPKDPQFLYQEDAVTHLLAKD